MPTITRVEIFRVAIPFAAPFRIALALLTDVEIMIVRIHDDAERYGIGEGCPAFFVTGETTAIAMQAAQVYARAILGKNPLEIRARLAEMNAALVHNTAIKCAFDLALYDLLGKHANLPVYALLGGSKQSIRSNLTLGIDEPGIVADKARAHKDNGATMLKIKVGTGKREDVARIKAIRQAVGDLHIQIDANQGWDVPTAIATLQAMAEYDVQFCEQPVAYWDHAGLKRVRDYSPIPIMADEAIFDEHDAFKLATMGACDYFNIKLAKAGGIDHALKINVVGESAGIKCMLGGMAETRLAVTAGAHLIAACPNIAFADLDSPFHFKADPVIGGISFARDGRVELPDAPGWGADFDPAWLERSDKITIDV